MTQLALDIHGIPVLVEGDEDALGILAIQFFAFVRDRLSATPTMRIEIRRDTPQMRLPRRQRADQVVERGLVYNNGSTTWVDHHGLALSQYDFASNRGTVVAQDAADLIEHAYLMIHARLGPMLEKRGLVRVHALGIARNNSAALVLLPSGGGKSRLALSLVRHTHVELLSDDVVLLDKKGWAHPFPMPIGVSSPELVKDIGEVVSFSRRHHGLKYLLRPDNLSHRFATRAYRVSLIVRALRVSEPPSRMVAAPRSQAVADLCRDAVVGLGLPQVIELMARRGMIDLWRQIPTGLRRLTHVAAVVRRARNATLEIADPDQAAILLETSLAN